VMSLAGRAVATRAASTFAVRASTALSRNLLQTPKSSLVRAAYSTAARTKGDQELCTFLNDEIDAEKKQRKSPNLPSIPGFEVKVDESEVFLTRKFNDETITVELNVNHSVDSEEENPQFQQAQPNAAEVGEMLSKPNFDVIIERQGKKLYFSCTFNMNEEGQQASQDDTFSIVEFAMYEGSEMKDQVYSVSGDIMDGCLYDLLMNLLEERGVTNEFADQLVEFTTHHEHALYISLLEKLKKFVS